MPEPIFVVGLDGASWTMLEPAMAAGLMPGLAHIIHEGAWGHLASTVPPFTAPAWSTFMTGKGPGRHGVLGFYAASNSPSTQSARGTLVTSPALGQDTIWSLLGARGYRVGVVNVPLTYPPRPVEGFLVTGLLTPIDATDYTFPPSLACELGPDYVIEPDYLRRFTEQSDLGLLPARTRLLEDLDRAEAARTATCLQLIERYRPDFFMVVYTSTDRLSHFFWEYLDDTAPGAGRRHPALLEGVRDHLRNLDAHITALVRAAGPRATVFFMSDHGFGPTARRWVHVNRLLQGSGLLQITASTAGNWRNPAFWKARLADSRLKRLIRRLLPDRVQRAVRKAEDADSLVAWPLTRAYFVPLYAHIAGISVNLSGRQLSGAVPTADYEAIRDAIIASASSWTDPYSGARMVRQVRRREEVYAGPFAGGFPDIIVEFDADYSAVGTLPARMVTEADATERTGDHRSEGIWAARGPAIRPGETQGATIADLAPTILHLAGVPVPSDMDGRVLTDALHPDWLAAHPVVVSDEAAASVGPDQPVYTPEEEALLRQHLAALGYLS